MKTSLLFSLLLIFLNGSEPIQKYNPFFIGKCTLDIPYTYFVGAQKNFVSFSNGKIFWNNIGDTNDYRLYWGNIEDAINGRRINAVREKKIRNLILYKSVGIKSNIYYISGKDFYILTSTYNKDAKHLIDSCNNSWAEAVYTKDDIKFFQHNLEKDFLLLEHEAKYVVKAIFSDINSSYEPNINLLEKDIEIKMKQYLKTYCISKECIFFIP